MENNGISYQLSRAKMKMVESNCRITNNALDRLDTHLNWTATKPQETAANGAKQWQHDVTNVHERRVV